MRYIYKSKRVKQLVDAIKVPSGTFDEVIKYLQELKEEYEALIGEPVKATGDYRHADNAFDNGKSPRDHHRTEEHAFDVFYITSTGSPMMGHGIAIVGERDMTEAEVSYQEQMSAEDRRKYEELFGTVTPK